MAIQDVIDRLTAKVSAQDRATVQDTLKAASATLCNMYGLQLGHQPSGMYDASGVQMTIADVFRKLAEVLPPMRLDAALLDRISTLVNNT